MSAAAFAPSTVPHRPTITRPSYDPAIDSVWYGRRPPRSLTTGSNFRSAASTASTNALTSSRASPALSSPTSSSTLSSSIDAS
eukprot:6176258-Pleurochrysis_carterae.AAC.1